MTKKVKMTPFFRNFGVRGGVQEEDMGTVGDDGTKQNSDLGYNMVTSSSMRFNFPFLDNMEPVAPMDRVNKGDGAFDMDATYVSEYQNPDAFPVVKGSGCMCQSPDGAGGKIQCECGNNTETDHYTWLKETPVLGTNNYTLEPADISYRAGNYWEPSPRHGIVAPADRLPDWRYPNQAPANYIWPLPASADGDRVAVKYARYLDQVHARSSDCDTVSDECTVPCMPGDAVNLNLGNMNLPAVVLKTFAGNTAQVEFAPAGVLSASEAAIDCSHEEVSCTVHRMCKTAGGRCIAEQDIESHGWDGRLILKHGCPAGTRICRTVTQLVTADYLKKDGKACRAAFKPAPGRPTEPPSTP